MASMIAASHPELQLEVRHGQAHLLGAPRGAEGTAVCQLDVVACIQHRLGNIDAVVVTLVEEPYEVDPDPKRATSDIQDFHPICQSHLAAN